MVFIIIPVFNRIDFTLKCIKSVAAQTYRDYKIIVVDDGSTDGTAEKIKESFPAVTILKGDGNYFWTRCVNTALLSIQNELTENDFALHINNDTEIESNYIEQMLSFHSKHPNSLVGSLAYDPDSKKVSHLGIFYNPWWPFVKRNFREQEIDPVRLKDIEYLATDTISARGMLIPGYIIKKIGLLDEHNFPQYRSDEDYGLSCKKAGINVYIATSCVVYNSRVNTGYDHNIHKVSWKKFYQSLFSKLSTNNLFIRWNWAKKNARIPIFYYPIDVSILFMGFFKRVIYTRVVRKKITR